MNILVLGGGGREHAITWALAKSARTDELFVAPGNGGTSDIAQNVAGLNAEDGEAVLAFVQQHAIDLVVIGPEAPLVAGVADVLRAAGVAVFGPDAQGAQLEGSKTYSKEFMEANGIPTARYGSFTELEPALAYVRELGAPVVVKADGLAAGKGVVVAQTIEEAEEAVRSCFDGAFGDAGSKVLVEECLTGPECSLLAFVSGGKAHFQHRLIHLWNVVVRVIRPCGKVRTDIRQIRTQLFNAAGKCAVVSRLRRFHRFAPLRGDDLHDGFRLRKVHFAV